MCSRARPSRFYARQWPSSIVVRKQTGFWRPLPLIMTSRAQRDKGQKQNTAQTILSELLKEEENKYCSDCKAKGMEPFIDRSSSVGARVRLSSCKILTSWSTNNRIFLLQDLVGRLGTWECFFAFDVRVYIETQVFIFLESSQ